jgi:inorganic phosphate transporter, PiT family
VIGESAVLVLVVVVALAFDFTNGFHDTANAMACSIATGALRPKAAVAVAGLLNLVGAFLSVEVALTVTNAVIRIQNRDGTPRTDLIAHGGSQLLLIVLAGLIGGILWNLFTWLHGLPSSSSHALFGGLIGAAIAGLGPGGINWAGNGAKLDGVVGKVILPALLSPVIAAVVAVVGTRLVYSVTSGMDVRSRDRGFRLGQIGSASLISLSHGTNDAQKTMGVITLALIAAGQWTQTGIPFWVKAACAVAIASGTYLGGWRIIRTMGKGLVDIAPPQGLAADTSSASVILVSSQLGFALSTTHVATGSITGAGLGGPGRRVRWGTVGRMVTAWLITLPSAAVVGALMWWIAHLLGGLAGSLVIVTVLCTLATWMWLHSRTAPIDHTNVNDDWHAPPAPAIPGVPVASAAQQPSPTSGLTTV